LGAIEKKQNNQQEENVLEKQRALLSAGKIKKDIKRMAKRATAIKKPLARPIRDRVEREASYKRTQQDMNKWMPQIKHNREAETMDFVQDPMVSRNLPAIVGDEKQREKVKTQLENDIMNALKKQGLESEQKIKVFLIFLKKKGK